MKDQGISMRISRRDLLITLLAVLCSCTRYQKFRCISLYSSYGATHLTRGRHRASCSPRVDVSTCQSRLQDSAAVLATHASRRVETVHAAGKTALIIIQ